jgi:hypothetical protein
MDEHELKNFQRELLRAGYDYDENEVTYLWNVAKRCALTAGVPMGATAGVMTAGAGMVSIPVVGAVPGWFVGALSGFVAGTAVCTFSKSGYKRVFDQLLLNRR